MKRNVAILLLALIKSAIRNSKTIVPKLQDQVQVSRLSHRLRSLPKMIFKSFLADITSFIEIKIKIIKKY